MLRSLQNLKTGTTNSYQVQKLQCFNSLIPVCLYCSKSSRESDFEKCAANNIRSIPFRGQYDQESCDKRRAWVERFSGVTLDYIGQWPKSSQNSQENFSTKNLQGNIENAIGFAKIPLGIAGPLSIRGDHVTGNVLCPIASTEGALLASVSRGSIAINRSGGVRAKAIKQRISRVPVFVTDDIDEATTLSNWLTSNSDHLSNCVKETSNHVILTELSVTQIGRSLHVTFAYETGDAAGQNGTTRATWRALEWVRETVSKELPQVNIQHMFIDGNGSGDKKVSAANYLLGRGTEVQAEVVIPELVLTNVLKVDVDTLLSLYSHAVQGSQRFGVQGFNINVANVIAGLFTATGQDIACLEECSTAFLNVQPAERTNNIHKTELKANRGIYACLVLPSLLIGTVGGGTNLPTQRECLEIMGCYGTGKKFRFAEIVASFALALELSTLASAAAGDFAHAHEKMGRNRPT